MADKEKIFNGVRSCAGMNDCSECPYFQTDDKNANCIHHMMLDAEEVMKSQDDFCKWLAKCVLEEQWEESPGFYAEVICRKLVKLGYLDVVEENYVLNEKGEQND